MSYQPCTGFKATIVRQTIATTLAAVCGHTCLIMTVIGMLGATPCAAAPGELLFKLVSPEPQPGADFGSTLAIVDGDILIGEPNRAVNNTAYVGQAYLFDGQSGELEHLFENPEPGRDDAFGAALAGGDGMVFLSAGGLDYTVNAFDAASGQYLYRIDDPNPSPSGSLTANRFGTALTYGDGTLAITAPGAELQGEDEHGRLYLYSPHSTSPDVAIDNPTDDTSGFGIGLGHAVFGGKIAAGAVTADSGVSGLPNGEDAGRVWVFDRFTGEVAFTLENPHPESFLFDWFGWAVAANDDIIVVGAQEDTASGVAEAGGVYVYDSQTGELEMTLFSPQLEDNGEFGRSVALTPSGDILVGAWGTSADGVEGAGHVYLFNGESGDLLLDIPNPEPTEFAAFGWSVAALDDRVVVGTLQGDSENLPATGAVYVFSTVPEPQTLLLSAAAALVMAASRRKV